MAKDGSSNETCELFEPFCQWKRLQDSDILEVHLPEFKKEQLRVRISNNSLLTISGERPTADDAKKMQFHREIKLSRDIYPDQIRAKFGGGVLSIIMPKKSSVSPKTQEVGKPKAEESDTAVSEGKQAAAAASEKDNTKPEKFISGLRSSLSRWKFGQRTAAATVVAVVIVALGAYYLTEN